MPQPGTGTLLGMIFGNPQRISIGGDAFPWSAIHRDSQDPSPADLYTPPVRKPDKAGESTPTHVKGDDRSTRITGGVHWT